MEVSHLEPLKDPFSCSEARRLAVFGHPTHELAVLGLLQRHRPQIVVITDGGGDERIAQSRRGLEILGLLDQATFLGYPEKSFYRAMLYGDLELFERVAQDLADALRKHRPDQVYCDAVEFYNPVHDITLPLVLRAMSGLPPARVFEVPLVYQLPGPEEIYRIQRVPDAFAPRRFAYHLSSAELEAKVFARDHVHITLREQAGPEFLAASPEHLASEEIAEFTGDFPAPDESIRVLRYEWRARLLQNSGAVKEVITYAGHFEPLAKALLG